MSFTITCQFVRDGDFGLWPRTIVDETFRPYLSPPKSELAYPEVTYPEGSGYLSVRDDPEICGFSINRPPGDCDGFWECMFRILREVPSFLTWGEQEYLIANEATIPHLPTAMIWDIGMPIVITEAKQIPLVITGKWPPPG